MGLIVPLLTLIQTKEQFNTLMKALLEFNLTDPDDVTSHLRCIKATDMAIALWHIRMLRKDLEWMEDNKDLTTENVMSKIFEILDDNNVNTDELTS